MTVDAVRGTHRPPPSLKFLGVSTNAVEHRLLSIISLVLISSVAFVFSDWLVAKYTNGDLLFYRFFFDLAGKISPDRVPAFQYDLTGSYEPVFGLLVWTAARLTSHDTFVNVLNVIMVVALVLFLQRHRASPLIYPLVLTNYYVLVLLTGAERLKVAVVFLLLAILARGAGRAALAVAAVLSHGSLVVIFVSAVVRQAAAVALSGRRIMLWRTVISLGAGVSVVLFTLSLYGSNLLQKFQSYASFNLDAVVNTFLISAVAVFISMNRFATAAMYVPLVSAAYIVGSTRITMLALFVCFYIAVESRRTASLPFLLLMAYMSFKSIDFVQSVIQYGNGFRDYVIYSKHGLGLL